MTDFPARGQKAPAYWDTQLKAYIDEADDTKADASDTASALTSKADDSAVVKVSGNQTIAGTKTFSSPPVVPNDSFSEAKVTGLVSDLSGKEPARTAATQAEAEAGTSTAIKGWSPERVKQAIAALAPTGGGGGGSTYWTRSKRIAAQQLASLPPRGAGASMYPNEWYAPPYDVTSTAIPAEARLLGQPMLINRDCLLTDIAVGVTTAGSSGAVVRLGILSFQPGEVVNPYLLVDAGTVDATTSGWKTLSFTLPVGRGQVIIPVAVVQGGATTRPTLRMQTGGEGPRAMLSGTDTTLLSAAGYGTWAYAGVSGALLAEFGGGTTLRSPEAAPRVMIRATSSNSSILGTPRPIVVPENVRFRGSNLTVKYAHTQMWGTNWDWNYFKNQIDLAATVGVNGIRVMGGQGAVVGGTATQSVYLGHWTQMADYVASKGMYFYPCLAGDNPVSGGALVSAHNTIILATAALLDSYSNVIGYDVYNEGQNSGASDTAALRTLLTNMRAATPKPITMSRAANTVGHVHDETRSTRFTDLVDFEDFHLYTDAVINWQDTLRWWRTQWYGQRPSIIGEFGASMSLTSAERTARYANVKALLDADPYSFGAFQWAVIDTGDGSVPATSMGLFTIPGVARPEMVTPFQTFPKTE